MKIFLDTTQNNFVACLFDEKYQIINKLIKETTHKVEQIPFFFNNLLVNQKINISDIDTFYINIGPGSFTGSRITLIYVRTIAQITGAKIGVTNSFKLLNSQEQVLMISANKGHSFKINFKDINNLSKTTLISKSDHEHQINYDNLLSSFNTHLDLFQFPELFMIKPVYGSMPQIGNKK